MGCGDMKMRWLKWSQIIWKSPIWVGKDTVKMMLFWAFIWISDGK
jgi:hypothetical protein